MGITLAAWITVSLRGVAKEKPATCEGSGLGKFERVKGQSEQ